MEPQQILLAGLTLQGRALLTLAKQVTMPNPCAGVPDNPWCAAGVLVTAPGTTVPETPLLILVFGTHTSRLLRHRADPQ